MEYIENPEADWRKQKLLEVRELILRNAGDIGEGIEYKMLCYGYEGKNIFHLNAQRVYVSLYVRNIGKVAGADKMLSDFDRGKGCIRVKKKVALPYTRLEDFIR